MNSVKSGFDVTANSIAKKKAIYYNTIWIF